MFLYWKLATFGPWTDFWYSAIQLLEILEKVESCGTINLRFRPLVKARFPFERYKEDCGNWLLLEVEGNVSGIIWCP